MKTSETINNLCYTYFNIPLKSRFHYDQTFDVFSILKSQPSSLTLQALLFSIMAVQVLYL